MNVFIDANIFLGFFGLAPGELEELRKLGALVDQGDISLWLPEHVCEEFVRNRPKVLSEALKALRESRLRVVIPELSRALPESTTLEDAVRVAQRAHSDLASALERAIEDRALEADRIIADLFESANRLPTHDLLQNARDRRDLRRPPGKADSLGDALNWEALLRGVPAEEDVHIISADGDFRSMLSFSRINEFLAAEWAERNGADARLYRDLGTFSREHFPALALATDAPKLRAIRQLASSANFVETHRVVARLSDAALFTPEQARLLISAAASNSQVRWIASDEDVFALLRRVIDAHRASLDENEVAVLEQSMHPPAPLAVVDDDDNDLPF